MNAGHERLREKQMAEMVGTDDFIAVAAFRYALGRQTYAVPHIINWLVANRDVLSDNTRELMVKEVHEAANRDAIGGDVDKREWLEFATALLRVAA